MSPGWSESGTNRIRRVSTRSRSLATGSTGPPVKPQAPGRPVAALRNDACALSAVAVRRRLLSVSLPLSGRFGWRTRVDPETIDQNYAQLQQQAQQTAAQIQRLAGKLQAAAAAGDPNAREWMLDLKEITLGVQQEQGQVSLLLQSIHSMVNNHVQTMGQPGYQQAGYQPGYQQQGYQPGYQPQYQQPGYQ